MIIKHGSPEVLTTGKLTTKHSITTVIVFLNKQTNVFDKPFFFIIPTTEDCKNSYVITYFLS